MSKYIPTGGPAFPVECNIVNGFRDDSGMTLRDWFAGQVLSNMDFRGETPSRAADWAYSVADAMLAEKFKADEINEQARKEGGDDLPW